MVILVGSMSLRPTFNEVRSILGPSSIPPSSLVFLFFRFQISLTRSLSVARTFYHSVFDWKFRDSTTRMDGTEEDPTKIVHFSFGDGCPGGGITKVDQVVKTNGKGGVVLYLMVDDLEGAMKV